MKTSRRPTTKVMRDTLAGAAQKAAGFALIVSAFAGPAVAGGGGHGGVPEIDPGSAISALTVLGGGLLLVTDRFRRRSPRG
jgi:hypothetical protein